MDELSERRLVENQRIFRALNYKLKSDALAAFGHADDLELGFYCECADRNCHERMQMAPDRWQQLHNNSRVYTIKPGHELTDIEEITQRGDDYLVVKKF